MKNLAVIFLAGIFLAGCVKKVQGPKGDPGEPASGTIERIQTFSLNSSAWTISGTTWSATIFSSLINKNVLNHGSVKVYMQDQNKWWPLPYGEHGITYQYGIEEGRIELRCYDDHEAPEQPATMNFRAVILAPAE